MSNSSIHENPFNLIDVHIAGKPKDSRWNVCGSNGSITSIEPSNEPRSGRDRLLTPSFCHPHIHLDKCFLLSHPKYADLEIKTGDFAEALSLTNEAKARFSYDDLLERGRALIEESISFGVTHMRAFTEVDATVQFKCLEAGLELKDEFKSRCLVQICVFAQDPIFSYEDGGEEMRKLLEEAVTKPGVDAFGSTPYVEGGASDEKQKQNIEYAVLLAKRHRLHLDFHIDYNLDPGKQSLIWQALDTLNAVDWPLNDESVDYRTIVFGHATRLTLFSQKEWQDLAQKIDKLPVSFVGLPTSDLFMMGKPSDDQGGGTRVRGTLQVLQMIKKYGLNATIGINNVGNAFTPQGNCDPLSIASTCVGIYQAGTENDCDTLLECITSRAKIAIGLQPPRENLIGVGHSDVVVFSSFEPSTMKSFRQKASVAKLIYDGGRLEQRVVYAGGKRISW